MRARDKAEMSTLFRATLSLARSRVLGGQDDVWDAVLEGVKPVVWYDVRGAVRDGVRVGVAEVLGIAAIKAGT